MKFPRGIFVAIVLAAGPLSAAPKEEPPQRPPPLAQSQAISIYRGRSIEIPLRAIGRAPGQLKFLIRTKPRHGRLGPIRVTSWKTASVTYTHDDSAGTPSDVFSFAVQAVDTPVSAPGMVRISISEQPPALSVVHALDFGKTLIGETSEEEITIRNSGGGLLAGRVSVPAPWKILGDPDYSLTRREEKKIRLLFAPKEEREYFEKLAFSHDARSSVNLSGIATSPFAFLPPRGVDLASPDGGPVRSGGLVIRNLTSRDRTVEIMPPPETSAPEQAEVPAGGEATIPLQTRTGFLGAIDGAMDIESEGFQIRIPVRAFALQPVLAAEPPAGIDFGEIEPRLRHAKTLGIRNDGGVAARLRATTSNDILIIPDPTTVVVQPGETRRFEVALETSGTGAYRDQIILEADGSAKLVLPVTASLRESSRKPSAPPTPIPAPLVPAPPASGPDTEKLADIPAVHDVAIRKVSERNYDLIWKKPAPEAVGTIIENRLLEISENGQTRVHWRELKRVKYSESEGNIIAKFENLVPGETWHLRISSIDADGRRSSPSQTVRLAVTPAKKISPAWAIFPVLAIAAAVIVLIRRRQRAEALGDEERISRIGRS